MLRMAGIVSQPQPLKGLQKQRGYASQTVALLNEEPLLFTKEPERVIFIHRLHVTAGFFCHCFISECFNRFDVHSLTLREEADRNELCILSVLIAQSYYFFQKRRIVYRDC